MPKNSAQLYTEVNTVHIYTWWFWEEYQKGKQHLGKPTAICFFVPDQKYIQLVFVLLHSWAPTAIWYFCFYPAPCRRRRESREITNSVQVPTTAREEMSNTEDLPRRRSISRKLSLCLFEIKVRKSFVKLKIKTKWLLNVNFMYSYGKKEQVPFTPWFLSRPLTQMWIYFHYYIPVMLCVLPHLVI